MITKVEHQAHHRRKKREIALTLSTRPQEGKEKEKFNQRDYLIACNPIDELIIPTTMATTDSSSATQLQKAPFVKELASSGEQSLPKQPKKKKRNKTC